MFPISQRLLYHKLNRAQKEGNREAVLYYTQCLSYIAPIGFDEFRNTPVYKEWKELNKDKLSYAPNQF